MKWTFHPFNKLLKKNLNFLAFPFLHCSQHTSWINHAASLYQFISKVISACDLHTAEWWNLMACGCCISPMMHMAISPPHYSACLPSITILATSVILLLGMLLLTIFCGSHTWKVLSRTSCQCGSTTLKDWSWQQCTVANSKLIPSKLHSSCNTFNLCYWYWCENLRQTDNVTNTVPESPTVCHQPSPFSITDSSTSILILVFMESFYNCH